MRTNQHGPRGIGRPAGSTLSRVTTPLARRLRLTAGAAATAVAVGLFGALSPASAALPATGAGAVDPATGFPSSYTDGSGLSLQQCLDGLPICSTTTAMLMAANGSGEGFYFVADANLTDAAISIKYHTGLEGAWLAAPDPTGAVDNRVTFMRTQVAVAKGGLVPNAQYTVDDPWGRVVCTADANGFLLNAAKGCRTQTAAIPGDFATALGGRIGPFLTWDTFGQAVGAPPAGYIGDFVTPHAVTGSPTGFNKVRMQGPGLTSTCAGAAGPIPSCVETDLFLIQGKVQPGASAATSASSLDFGNVSAAAPATKSFTYTNTSTDGTSVNVTSVALSAGSSSDYSLGGTCTVGLLPPGASCTVDVIYSPAGTSPAAGTVVVSSDTPTIGDRSITLTGRSVGVPFVETPAPPAALTFGNQATGTSSPENVIVVGNSGVADVSLSSRTLTGTGAAQFSLTRTTNTCATTGAAPAGGCESGVVFAPMTNGTKSANLQMTFSDGSVLNVPLTGTGVAPAAAPGAPTAVTATAGNAAASVSWTAPASPGTSAITGYTVQAFNGTAAVGTPLSVAAAARAATVTGLTNGTSYTIHVKALSAVGAGAAGVSNAVVPRAPALPGTPTGVTATRGNASATVRWVAPTTGGAVTGYQVRVSTGGVQVGALHAAASTARSLVVTGLRSGTTYAVQVRATSAGGTGAFAAAVSVRPLTTPGAPVIGTAVSGVAGGTVTAKAAWGAPTSNGGTAVTGYRVRALRMSSTGAVLSTTISAVQPATARALTMTLPAVGSLSVHRAGRQRGRLGRHVGEVQPRGRAVTASVG